MFLLFLAQSLFQKPARLLTLATGKAFGLNPGRTVGRDNQFDGFQDTPPVLMVTLMEPSCSDCSVTEYPLRLASILAFSTA